jgi:hypothetical protein
VVIRLRPLLPFETSRGDSTAFTCSTDGHSLTSSSGKKFSFEHVFGPSVGQQEFFQDSGLVRLLDSAMDGFSATIFAYGQTGSGKTHTIRCLLAIASSCGVWLCCVCCVGAVLFRNQRP